MKKGYFPILKGFELPWEQKSLKTHSTEKEKLCAFFMPKIRRYNEAYNRFRASEIGSSCPVDDGGI